MEMSPSVEDMVVSVAVHDLDHRLAKEDGHPHDHVAHLGSLEDGVLRQSNKSNYKKES